MIISHSLPSHQSRAAFINLLGAVVLLAVSTAAVAAETAVVELYPRFKSHMDQCTATYGFDPKGQEDFGETELAPFEREWRVCIYQGVVSIIVPSTNFPMLYFDIVNEDRRMTAAIVAGSMTRSERRARLDAMIAHIEASEQTLRGSWEQEMQRLEDVDQQAEISRIMEEAYRQAIDSMRAVKVLNLN